MKGQAVPTVRQGTSAGSTHPARNSGRLRCRAGPTEIRQVTASSHGIAFLRDRVVCIPPGLGSILPRFGKRG
jgi:hypothetical protein